MWLLNTLTSLVFCGQQKPTKGNIKCPRGQHGVLRRFKILVIVTSECCSFFVKKIICLLPDNVVSMLVFFYFAQNVVIINSQFFKSLSRNLRTLLLLLFQFHYFWRYHHFVVKREMKVWEWSNPRQHAHHTYCHENRSLNFDNMAPMINHRTDGRIWSSLLKPGGKYVDILI